MAELSQPSRQAHKLVDTAGGLSGGGLFCWGFCGLSESGNMADSCLDSGKLGWGREGGGRPSG